jgi:hypothetical protein
MSVLKGIAMIILAPVEDEKISLERSIFLSLFMSETISKESLSGKLKFSTPLYPVHLPFATLYKPFFGKDDHRVADLSDWKANNFPMQYSGENLNGKRLIVFPMHGLGDQLYLATTIRNLMNKYQDLEIAIVKSGLSSAEPWYEYIYFEDYYTLTGPVVAASELSEYDYFVNSEHFSHMEEYKGTYPSVFYYEKMFHHENINLDDLKPKIKKPIKNHTIENHILDFKRDGLPVLFINSMTTGRVRDIPNKAVIDFAEMVKDRCNIIISVFKNPSLNIEIQKLSVPNIISSEGLISSPEDLINLISQIDFVLTSDSGVTHLAEALNKPCGSIFNVVSSKERIEYYEFSEEMDIEFEIEGVCKTPCYVHALPENIECPGMEHFNKIHRANIFYEYPPCMQNLSGEHLYALFDMIFKKVVQ